MPIIPTKPAKGAKRITIVPYRRSDGDWGLRPTKPIKDLHLEETFGSQREAEGGCRQLWPSCFPWFGKPSGKHGWSIVID